MRIRQVCLTAWNILDPIYFHFTRLQQIKKSCGSQTIMRVRLTKYKGRKVELADGTVINKNDKIVKIHLHNVKLLSQMQRYESDIRKALILYKSVQDSLPSIAHYIQSHSRTKEIKGLIGITMLYKGCKKLGFEPHPISNWFYRTFKRIGQFPIYLLSSQVGFKKDTPSPLYLFMSKDILYKKYL